MFLCLILLLLTMQVSMVQGMRVDNFNQPFATVKQITDNAFSICMKNHCHGEKFTIPLIFQSEDNKICTIKTWYENCETSCLKKAAGVLNDLHLDNGKTEFELQFNNRVAALDSVFNIATGNKPLSSYGIKLISYKKQLTQK